MGSFGNLVSACSPTSRGWHDAERGTAFTGYNGDFRPKWELVYYQWKKPEIACDRGSPSDRDWSLASLWVVFRLITFGEYGFLSGCRSIAVDYVG
jgi:hypothetical protein